MFPDGPIVLFDGDCGFCNRSVQFVLDHEAGAVLRFAGSGTEIGRAILGRYGIDGPPGSVVLVEDGTCYTKSDASLRLARYLRKPWAWMALGVVIPEAIRNLVYGWIAANRHRLGGKSGCRVNRGEWRGRFLG